MRSLPLLVLLGLVLGASQGLDGMITSPREFRLTAEEQRALQARLESLEARQKAVEDLMEGRRTLAETTEEFRRIAVKQPETMVYLRLWYPCCPDGQLIHRQILEYANHWLNERDRDWSALEEREQEIEILEAKDSTSARASISAELVSKRK